MQSRFARPERSLTKLKITFCQTKYAGRRVAAFEPIRAERKSCDDQHIADAASFLWCGHARAISVLESNLGEKPCSSAKF